MFYLGLSSRSYLSLLLSLSHFPNPNHILLMIANLYLTHMLAGRMIPSPRLISLCSAIKASGIFQQYGHTNTREYNQPRSLSTDKWVRKMWGIYTMAFHSDAKKTWNDKIAGKWMKQGEIIPSEAFQAQTDKDCMYVFPFMWVLVMDLLFLCA